MPFASAVAVNSIVSIAVVFVVALLFALRPVLKRRRRRRALAQPFPKSWERILRRNVPVYKMLNDDLKRQYQDLIKIFLAEKTFVGYQGVEIDDDVRLTVAGQACLLLLNRETDVYPLLNTIVMYPSAFYSTLDDDDDDDDDDDVRLGESWSRGSVILAWDHSKSDAKNFHDGHNVVIHEFAHQLDQLSGSADGAPVLADAESYATWAKVMREDYLKLREKVEERRPDVLDDYGATDPAEFFAVASETFFERPKRLAAKHPEVFAQLLAYYRVDPRDWN